MNNIIAKVKEVRELISDPNHWCQDSHYLNEKGEACDMANAVSFCLVGAISKVGDTNGHVYNALKSKLARDLSPFNDSHSHQEVLAFLDSVIDEADQHP